MLGRRVDESTPVLELRGVSKRFGGFLAVDDVSLTLTKADRRALIGPNGAGKTTLFNLISGRLRPDAGEITYRGRPISRLSAPAICRMGVARTFQITSVYPKLTCLQNVQTSLFARHGRSYWLFRRSDEIDAEEAIDFLHHVGIAAMALRQAALLSYGDQKRLELAMVLALQPQLLLLDEPTAGVEVQTRRELVSLIRNLCTEHGLTLLFCEHDMDAVFGISDRITVMHQGRVLVEGRPEEVQRNELARSIYLGTRHGGAPA
jgi:branched-chain amino acid transport system ATP-binding protein